MRLTLDKQAEYARELLRRLGADDRRRAGRRRCSTPTSPTEAGIAAQRERVGRAQASSLAGARHAVEPRATC